MDALLGEAAQLRQTLEARLDEARELFQVLMQTDAPALRERLAELGLPDIISMRAPNKE